MNDLKLYSIKLSYEELLLLDGNISEEAQKVVNIAKREANIGFELSVMNEIVRQAEEKGELTWRFKDITSCNYCDKQRDYQRYARSGRYHNKGDKNFSKPIYYRGVEFNGGFITIQGHGDMCSECCSKHNVIEKLVNYILDEDLKIEIQKNEFAVTKYLKDDIRICYSCDTEMKESEMGRERTVMGDGSYPSRCPKCDANSSLFGRSHKVTNKFEHIINPKFTEV